MTRVLLTGGSGFIAAHVLKILLEQNHSVVTTVRSIEKANKIKALYPNEPKDKLDFVVVDDIAKPGAFDEAVKSDPPFEAVIHTASPFHFNVTDVQKELLDPAVNGSVGILDAIRAGAPSIKRVVLTSSMAAIITPALGNRPGHTYTEKDWNPMSHEEALQNPVAGYRASKVFAEKAAWKHCKETGLELATICPPLVFGPITATLTTLDTLNTSNQRVRDMIKGKCKDEIPHTGMHVWVDVRDVALAHVKAMEIPNAAGKRFFVAAGLFSNKEIADILRRKFPQYKNDLPAENIPGGDYPDGDPSNVYSVDVGHTKSLLGINFRTLETSVVDLVDSLQGLAG